MPGNAIIPKRPSHSCVEFRSWLRNAKVQPTTLLKPKPPLLN